MVTGFQNDRDFAPIVGWELYQVTLDKYHVMFLFENGYQLLNVAYKLSHFSADGAVGYTYETGTEGGANNLGRLLRVRICDVVVQSERELALLFENGDRLIIHDEPSLCSWWFMPSGDAASMETAAAWSKWDTHDEC